MLILSAILENMTSRKDKTWKIVFGSNELTPEQIHELSTALNSFVFLAMKTNDFKTSEKNIIEGMNADFEDKGKSQSKRIQSVLYILWKQADEGFKDFESYYKHKTEKYIEHLKSKIED